MSRSIFATVLFLFAGQFAGAEDIGTPSGYVPAPVALPQVCPRPDAPQPPSPIGLITPTSPAQAKVAVLHQKQAELAQLTQEIRQLRFETRTQQQLLVRVQMLEFSLTKMRKMGVELPQASSGYFTGSDLSSMLTTASPAGSRPYTPPKTKANSDDSSNLVDWMTDNNIGKILAEPSLVLVEGVPARFHAGGEIPMPAKDNSKVVEYQPVGTQIDLLATSLGDDRVRLELKARVSEVDEGNTVQVNGTQYSRLRVRQMDTGIVSTFGQPTVLTGMIETRTETIRIASGVGEVANRVRGKASTRDVTNEICLMLVVMPERVDSLETAQRTAVQAAPK